MKQMLFVAPLLPLAVQAHDGHGLMGSHGHPADTLGWVVAAALVTGLLFLRRK